MADVWNDDDTFGTTGIKIAKDPEFRASVSSEKIDTATLTYTSYSSDGNSRHASDGTDSEDQKVTPRYRYKTSGVPDEGPSQQLYAIEVVNGTGVFVSGAAVTWLEVRSSREWAAQ